jgi:D-serine deaminase-like pyridoxal phosphate-dependent protein
MRAGTLLVLVGTASLVFTACGTSGDERDVRASVERFNAAIELADGEKACQELTEGATEQLERSEKKPCEEAIRSLELAPSDVASVEVFVVSGRADLTGGGAAFLDETSEGWKISAVGCEPRTEQPYECELES